MSPHHTRTTPILLCEAVSTFWCRSCTTFPQMYKVSIITSHQIMITVHPVLQYRCSKTAGRRGYQASKAEQGTEHSIPKCTEFILNSHFFHKAVFLFCISSIFSSKMRVQWRMPQHLIIQPSEVLERSSKHIICINSAKLTWQQSQQDQYCRF